MMSRVAGWYGKIPSLGDFASRRLSAAFIEVWDSWLQRSIAASRASLGDRWLEIYLTSPIWRFALMPEALGTSAWAGILMPSVDKVGRHFPLTIAIELSETMNAPLSILSAQSWFAELETVALAALDLNCSADDLEDRLRNVDFSTPSPESADPNPEIEKLALWWQRPASVTESIRIPAADALLPMFRAVAQSALNAGATGKTIWWSKSLQSESMQLVCVSGLPPDEQFTAFLLGMEMQSNDLLP
jgi:type VI secretion system protein ImpM